MQPTVLVAEDDPSIRMTLEIVLADEGFEVLMASDGETALALARSRDPDLILLDHMMPKLAGDEVLSALRSDEATGSIPVFLLTGLAEDRFAHLSDIHYVGKPFSPQHLVDRIKKVLKARGDLSA